MNVVKSILLFILAFTIMLLLVTCSNLSKKEDSVSAAEKQNEKRFKDKASELDASFVVEVVSSNMAELKMAEVGEQLAKKTEVKEIASMLKAQNIDVIDRFKNYADLRQISLPTDITPDAKKTEERVIDDGDQSKFDREWCRDIARMYDESNRKFNEFLPKLSDPELKDLANQVSSIVQLHYKKLLSCRDSLK